MSPTSRSRASASSSAPADRVRSSASAASAASDCISVTSSLENARFADVGAATSTPMIRSSTISGTKAPLLAPTASTSRGLTRGEAEQSKTTTGAAWKYALAIPEGSLRRSIRMSRHQVTSAPASRASKPLASSVSASISASAVNSIPSTDPTSSSRTRPAASGSVVRASASEIAATASSSRPRTVTSCSASRARAPPERKSPRSPQRARNTSAGRSAITLAANENQRWPPIALPSSRTAAPRIAAGIPMQGNIKPSARSFAVRAARSRHNLGATARATAR